MLNVNEDALICDLAEYYHIYDMRSLPLRYVAVLSCGLRENSRIKMILNNAIVPTDTVLLASAVDRLSMLLWTKTKDAERGENRPESIVAKLIPTEPNNKNMVFDSPEDFKEVWQKTIERGQKNV